MSVTAVKKVNQPSTEAAPEIEMGMLLRALLKFNASDLHLRVGRAPIYRIHGRLIPTKMPELTEHVMKLLVLNVLNDEQRAVVEKTRQLSTTYSLKNVGRFRVSIYHHLGTLSMAIRMIPLVIPSMEDLGLPPVLKDVCSRPRGLFLVTGASGTGKSTTLAAMIQYINENKATHILAIEDPIEYVHRDIKSMVTQREVGSDAMTLQLGLESALRHDPDVIVIGELLNHEMIQTALTAAETGHLVMATLHTNSAKSTIDRVVDVFPPEAQNQVRTQLASNLVGVISQQLLERADKGGRVVACEVMVRSPLIEEYIRKNEVHKIPQAIENSNTHYKMQSMNQALMHLVKTQQVTLEEALSGSDSPENLKLALSGVTRDEGYNN